MNIKFGLSRHIFSLTASVSNKEEFINLFGKNIKKGFFKIFDKILLL